MQSSEKFDPKADYERHETAHNNGGVYLRDDGKTKEAVLEVLKRVGAKLVEGSVTDLLKISRPAIISYHKTYLQVLLNDFLNTHYLDRAANEKDPVLRMKHVIAFIISGLHRTPVEVLNKGPLNPILGETLQAEKADGTKVYIEQTSHHPPITSYLLVGPKGSYRMYGSGEVDAKLSGLNNITGRRVGKNTIEFKNGGKIVYTAPDMRVDSLMIGERKLNFIKTVVFLDKINKVSAEITFNYDESGTIAKVANKIKGFFKTSKENKPPSDFFEIEIFNYEKSKDGEAKKTLIAEGSGSWLSYLQFDGEIFWKLNETATSWIIPNTKLPSDSAFREDAQLIEIKDYERAQTEKERLENLQRNDKKLREAYADKKKGK